MSKILVWLSGGVDSAVAAYLLREAGHEVECGFMINYLSDTDDCPTRVDMEEARRVAEYLGLPFHTFDFRDEYDRRIVEYIYEGYRKGITPNPDVLCNNLVKFDVFLREALEYGFDAIATGHYARIAPSVIPAQAGISWLSDQSISSWDPRSGRGWRDFYRLLKWLDPDKDQSYFLSRLDQFQLAHAMFPIGHLPKSQVREIARLAGLPNAERKDSQGLCFIGKVSMKEFLEKRLPKQTGNILDTSGKIVGQHEWAWSYTIGQRRGIQVGGGPALFVIAKDIAHNTITVGTEQELQLYSDELSAIDWHWISEPREIPFRAKAKIRHRQDDQDIELVAYDEGHVEIRFDAPQRAITSGQVVVVYDGDEVAGSGIIE